MLVKDLDIQLALEMQDEMDKNSISLLGISKELDAQMDKNKPILKIDKNCISCSTHKSFILKGFKMACLYYSPSNVQYDSKFYTRDELLKLRIDHLQNLEICPPISPQFFSPKPVKPRNPSSIIHSPKRPKMKFRYKKKSRCTTSLETPIPALHSIDDRHLQGLNSSFRQDVHFSSSLSHNRRCINIMNRSILSSQDSR
jgi:hypothetical protein